MNEDNPKNWKRGVEHPSEDDLLCFIDGELSPNLSEGLRSHLEACWRCRNRAEKLQSTISRFIDYRTVVLQPLISPPNNWGGFSSKLNNQAIEMPPPSIWDRCRSVINRFRAALIHLDQRTVRLAGISAITVLLGFMGVYFLFISSNSVVSAEELINLAALSRESELKKADQPVLYQQLRVMRRNANGEEAANVELWQDIDNLRIRKVVVPATEERGATVLSDLEQILRANKYEPPPLSIVGFQSWRNMLSDKRDSVVKLKTPDGVDALRLQTESTSRPETGSLISSVLIVRASDYHPYEQSFTVATVEGVQEFEVRETSFAVMSLNSLNPGFFADSVPMIVSARPSPAPSASASETNKAANANLSAHGAEPVVTLNVATPELEVEVLNLLHTAGADLGEQIEVRRLPGGPIVVSGVVETPERKTEILNALGALKDNPSIRIQISTVSEALAAEKSNRARPQPSIEQVQIDTDSYPAEGDLLAHFHDATAARSFAARMTGQSSRAMNYLWAMKRLKGQFSGSQIEKLSPEARGKWLNVIRSYARSYQSEIGTLRRELQPVFGGAGGSGDGARITSDAELMQTIDQLFAAGSGSNQVVRGAFTTSSSGINAIRTAQFWQTLNRAEVLAASISQYHLR